MVETSLPSEAPVSALSEREARQELKRLARLIQEHDRLYHQQDAPRISDAAYDALKRRNALIEERFPHLVRADSPSSRVGGPIKEGFGRVAHTVAMMSLSNALNQEEVVAFLNRLRRFLKLEAEAPILLSAEPKIDGLSASLLYEGGQFVRGATRGDGQVGEDITDNLRGVSGVPRVLSGKDVPVRFEVRGEVYMGHEDFRILNARQEKAGEKLFANPRNAAAGSVRQLDAKVTRDRPLRFAAHSWGEASVVPGERYSDVIDKMRTWGVQVVEHRRACVSSVEALMAYHEEMEVHRSALDYDIDGVVYKVEDLGWQARLGSVSLAPRWAIAHKFSPQQAMTVVEKISISVGRTGALTPVAELKPVTVGGVVVRRATLHNEEEIKRLDVREGDTVLVQRAGDVIPQVLRVLEDKRPPRARAYVFPHRCPVCGREAARGKEAEEVVRRCTGGFVCEAQAMARLRHFVSRAAFDIEGLGNEQIELFYKEELVRWPADIFRLQERYEEHPPDIWIYTSGAKKGSLKESVVKLFKQIESRRHVSLDRFIYALGIRHVGEKTALRLARVYGDFAALGQAVRSGELEAVEGIGGTVVQALGDFLRENGDVVEALFGAGVTVSPVEVRHGGVLAGKSVVFTGTLSGMTRAEAKAQAEQLGANISSTISAQTDYVVIGEKPGAKAKKAQALNIRILTEAAWLKLTGAG